MAGTGCVPFDFHCMCYFTHNQILLEQNKWIFVEAHMNSKLAEKLSF